MSPAALELTIDGRRIASSTQEQRARPYTAVIATATPELALRLHSTYGGSEHFTFLARWPHAGRRSTPPNAYVSSQRGSGCGCG